MRQLSFRVFILALGTAAGCNRPLLHGLPEIKPTTEGTSVVAQADVLADELEDIPLSLTLTDQDALLLANDVSPSGATLTVTAVSAAQHGTVELRGGIITFAPTADYSGPAAGFTYEVDDGSGQRATAAVTFTVLPVNDAPSFIVGANQSVAQDSGAQSVAGFATALSAGPADESGQTLDFLVTVADPTLFGTPPAIAADGTLTYTPASGKAGTTTVDVRLHDSGGIAHGGVDTSASQSFSITLVSTYIVPVAVNDTLPDALEDVPLVLLPTDITTILLANDTVAGGYTLSVTDAKLPSIGAVGLAGGVITFTAPANYHGAASFTYVIDDGTGATSEAVASFTVLSVNDVPSFTAGGNETVLEDAGAQSVVGWATALGVGPADEGSQTLTFVVAATTPSLFLVQPAMSGSGTLTYTPAANANGTTSVSVRAHDDGGIANGGVDTSVAQTFSITMTAVNDAPSFVKGSDVAVNEDDGPISKVAWATAISAGPADESGQVLNFTVTTSNDTLFDVLPAVDPSTGTLTFTSAANERGSATVTLTLHDNGGVLNFGADASTQTFGITVNPVNDAPSFTKGADETVNEDTGAHTVAGWATLMSVGPANESAQVLNFLVTVAIADQGKFVAQPAVDSATGNLTYELAPDAFGDVLVIVRIHDSGGTANGGIDTSVAQDLHIVIAGINDAPALTDINLNNPTATVAATPSAGELVSALLAGKVIDVDGTAVGIAVIAADTSNGTWEYDAGAGWLTMGGVAVSSPRLLSATMQVRFSPNPAFLGTATFTVRAWDGSDGQTAGTLGAAIGAFDPLGAFSATSAIATIGVVNAANAAPSFTKGANQLVNEDSGLTSVTSWATALDKGAPSESWQSLSFVIDSNDNSALFLTQPAVNGGTGTLTFTPAANANGIANITLHIKDSGGTANIAGIDGVDVSAPQSFVITVRAVNDPPSFVAGSDQTVDEDSGAHTLSGWASSISPGPADEVLAGQTVVVFNITGNSNAALFSVAPTVSVAGDLTFTTAPNANGTASITIVAQDDGGTLLGGVPNSAPHTLIIDVNAVNDAPSFTKGADVSVAEDSGLHTSVGWATGRSKGGGADESAQVLDFVVSNDNNALFLPLGQPAIAGATGTLTFTPAVNAFGSATVTVHIHDDGGTFYGGVDASAPQTFVVTVTPANDAPVVSGGSALAYTENAAAAAAAPLLALADIDSTNVTGATIQITTGAVSGDVLAAGSLPGAITFGSWNAGTHTLTLTGTDTLANYQVALRTVTYMSTSDNPTNAVRTITWTVTDDGAPSLPGSGTSTVNVTPVNDAPVVTAAALTAGPYYKSSTVTLNLGSLASTDPEGDTVTYAYAWKVNGVTVAGQSGTSLNGSFFAKGQTVICEVTPNDGTTNGAVFPTASVTIQNSAPVVTLAALSAGPYYKSSTVTLNTGTLASTDVDGDTATYTYAWKVAGATVGGQTGTSLAGSFFAKGQTVVCEVTPNDGTTNGAVFPTASVTIQNSAPAVLSAALTAGPYYKTSTVTFDAGSLTSADADGDSVTYTYAWKVNGATVGGQTGTSLANTFFAKGQTVVCEVTPNDGTTNGASFPTASVTIQNSAPVVTVAALTAGPYYKTSTVTLNTGTLASTDADGDTVTYTYAWKVAGATVGGQTGTSLANTFFAKGQTVVCEVTPNDGTTNGAAFPTASVTIQNSAPVVTVAALIAGPYYKTSAVTLNTGTLASTDADGDTVTYAYAWKVAGATVGGQTGTSLAGSFFAKGQTVVCEVTPNDGATDGAAFPTASVTIQNSAPVVTVAALTAGPYYKTSTVTLNTGTLASTDADGDTVTYTYAWKVAGATVGGQTGTSLAGSFFAKGQTVVCEVTPNDGTTNGAAFPTVSVTILNSLPVANALASFAFEGTSNTGTVTATDVDGDTLTYAVVTNSSDGTASITPATGAFTFAPTAGFVGATTFTFKANDGAADSSPATVSVKVHAARRIDVGDEHACSIKKADGTLWCWGSGDFGKLGNNATLDQPTPVQESSGHTDWAVVSTGGTGVVTMTYFATSVVGSTEGHTCAIRANGALYCWGHNSNGQIGNGAPPTNVLTPSQVGVDAWIDVSAGAYHTCGIKLDGSLWCWGRNANGQLGTGAAGADQSTPQAVAVGTQWAAIGAGAVHTCGVKTNGTLWCWGYNDGGQLGINSTTQSDAPTQETTLATTWTTVVAQRWHTCALTSVHTLYCWGTNNGDDMLGTGGVDSLEPIMVGADADWNGVAVGDKNGCATKSTGTLWCWGNNSWGQLGNGTFTASSTPVQAGTDIDWLPQLGGGQHLACALKANGTARCFGDNLYGTIGNGTNQRSAVPESVGAVATWTSVKSRMNNDGACGVRSDGTLWCWGQNSTGMIGDGSATSRKVFAQENTLATDWSSVAPGTYHTCANTTGNTIYCWGTGTQGQLGNGLMTSSSTPTQVSGGAIYASGEGKLAAGGDFTCAIATNNKLYCWGRNELGVVPNGNAALNLVTTPTEEVSLAGNWVQVSAGITHACAINSLGELYCWGFNRAGQLGTDPTGNLPNDCTYWGSYGNACSTAPYKVNAFTDWTSVAVSGARTCAVRASGALYCWGYNAQGELGNGVAGPSACNSYPCERTPVLLAGSWTSVSAGLNHTCGRTATGTLRCWGYNSFAQLGDGSLTTRTNVTFDLDGGSNTWASVGPGKDMSCATKATGALWCWGTGTLGGFGDGNAWFENPILPLIP